ncbi:hypothetical protein [Pseudoalteromonas ardens]|uniref:hypothetical protein n=1 Tax=Pseudoalteromonas ardens TaxID=3048490 RepID=UPI0024C38EE1|nr:hypothetical protein [Pseudoalteromonas sp. R96]MDK1310252.1 hypothetical protein [Pseudoalteromonas sp. R96]
MKYFLIVLSFICISTQASTKHFTQHQVNIKRLGSHAGQVFYMSFDKSFSTDCAWGNLYCPIASKECENFYSLVMTAKVAELKLSVVAYSQDTPGGSCKVTHVEID